MKTLVLSTAAYTVGTFALAVVWHVVLFEETYLAMGYFEDEPSFLLGLVTILIQGIVLSVLFPMVRLKGSGLARGLKFSTILGVFFWTSHVLAFLAKQDVQQVTLFVGMETGYLAMQFGLFGCLLGLIYSNRPTDIPDVHVRIA